MSHTFENQIDINYQFLDHKTIRFCESFHTGSHFMLLGDSGRGKTTCLQLISGLKRPLTGIIKIQNSLWFDHEKNINLESHKRSLAYVFQENTCFPHMTFEKNIQFCGHGLYQEEIQEILSAQELNPLLKQYPRTLSGGQRRLLCLLRGALVLPDLLLLDEPFHFLDKRLTQFFLETLKRIQQIKPFSIVFVTHQKQDEDLFRVYGFFQPKTIYI